MSYLVLHTYSRLKSLLFLKIIQCNNKGNNFPVKPAALQLTFNWTFITLKTSSILLQINMFNTNTHTFFPCIKINAELIILNNSLKKKKSILLICDLTEPKSMVTVQCYCVLLSATVLILSSVLSGFHGTY